MNAISTRPADVGDLAAITRVFLECWRESYATVLPAAVLARMDDDSALALWSGALSRPGVVIVAESDGEVLGIARFTVSGDAGYLASLYVSPRSQGSGLGGTLLGAAEAGMVAAGATAATLWVFAANAPSIGFYERRGWRANGATRVEEEFGAAEAGYAKALHRGTASGLA